MISPSSFFSMEFYRLHIQPLLFAGLIMLIGFLVARLLGGSISRAAIKHLTPQQTMLLRRFIFYLTLAVFAAMAFEQLGFRIGALLGAAGILTVAIGIASQTSMSNIISGVFMIGEKPFEVGHKIKVGETIGEVLSIDLLSVRLRTNDNTLVRIPNEVLIKTSITNLSFFPIRRADLKIYIGYQENIEAIQLLLLDIAYKNPLSLIEPKPSVDITTFGDKRIELQFSVWCARSNLSRLTNSIQMEVHRLFHEKGIAMSNPSIFGEAFQTPLSLKINPKEPQ